MSPVSIQNMGNDQGKAGGHLTSALKILPEALNFTFCEKTKEYKQINEKCVEIY
jgi:hypothetical protein